MPCRSQGSLWDYVTLAHGSTVAFGWARGLRFLAFTSLIPWHLPVPRPIGAHKQPTGRNKMNSVNITARLTADPELRFTPKGTPVCAMRVAIDRPGQDTAIFIGVTVWERLAESCADHLAKGRQVGISGRLDHSEWTDDQGTRHSRHEIVATTVDFLGRPSTTEADS